MPDGLPGISILYEVIEHTWPPARIFELPPWTVRDGAGGGKRVSSAIARGPVRAEDLPLAEDAMRRMAQTPLFMIREDDDALDRLLGDLGYAIVDPVQVWACPTAHLCEEAPPRTASFHIWEPLAIQRDIWADGGIGPERIAVMERASAPKTSLFGRHDNRPAATGFVAVHKGVAMVHAIHVVPGHRRAGMARYLMIEAARWARAQGAPHLAVVCASANTAANALYASLGFTLVGHYHYRIQKEPSV
ncbi:GNAT family N-acetyltransferase [Roseovarius sp. SCSIO 43702]|uniref:GNAT family N-acetyltransferase n=1 Tax=Roseovarius sp. SCSIO 43702 TaxID=2823043 RepID=UPI0038F752D5